MASRNSLHSTYTLAAFFAKAAFVFVCILLVGSACGRRKTEIADKTGEAEEGYSMFTTHVNVLVSDSGITQYQMKAREWYIYEGGENPRWYFPKGFFAEQVDTLMQRKASLKSDTAYHYTEREQWKFIGHVEVENLRGDTFLAKHLVWDKSSRKVSSEDSVTVITPDRRLTGTGFIADEDFSRYTFYNNSGQVAIPDEEMETSEDTTQRADGATPLPDSSHTSRPLQSPVALGHTRAKGGKGIAPQKHEHTSEESNPLCILTPIFHYFRSKENYRQPKWAS